MNSNDIEIYKKRYVDRLTKFGYSPEALGWGGGKEKQFIRFKNLLEIGCKNEESVLDVGCGFADLYGYLLELDITLDYVGVDINEKLLEVAKEIYPSVKVLCYDILEKENQQKFDWVISSGVFNAKLKYEDNWDYIKKMVTKMYTIAEKGVAIDFMSTFVDFEHPDAYHTSPAKLIEFSKNELKANVVLRMDYLPYEFCIYLKK